jgi:hypothetical protein
LRGHFRKNFSRPRTHRCFFGRARTILLPRPPPRRRAVRRHATTGKRSRRRFGDQARILGVDPRCHVVAEGIAARFFAWRIDVELEPTCVERQLDVIGAIPDGNPSEFEARNHSSIGCARCSWCGWRNRIVASRHVKSWLGTEFTAPETSNQRDAVADQVPDLRPVHSCTELVQDLSCVFTAETARCVRRACLCAFVIDFGNQRSPPTCVDFTVARSRLS